MNFIDVIKSIPEIAIYLRNGLQALGTYSKKVVACSTRDLEGSVDIDTNLKRNYPNAHRWDYVFGYKDRIFYVEIHPAENTRKVGEITAKLEWLKQWRKLYAKKLDDLEGKSSYHWISTGKTASSVKRGKYRLILAEKGISGPSSVLNVDSFL